MAGLMPATKGPMDAERYSQDSRGEGAGNPVFPSPADTAAAGSYRFVEIGHFARPDKSSPELLPAHFRFREQEGSGRGVIIEAEELPRFAEQYRTQAWASHFRYSISDLAEIRAAGSEGRLKVFGDYFFVFNASTSAEIVHAINQTIDLVEKLKEDFDVPYEAVTVYYAGRELEVQVDSGVFGAQPSARLPEIYRRMTRALLGLDPAGEQAPGLRGQVDFGAYRYDYLSQIPGTLVSSDPRETYKIRLSYTAFKKLSYQRLSEYSQMRPELPTREAWAIPAPRARSFYQSIVDSLQQATRRDKDTISSLFYGTSAVESQASSLRQLAPALLKRLFDEQRQFIATPSPQLNALLAGGLHPGDLHVLAGYPGSGTSTLALQMMNHAVVESGAHVVFAGLQRGVEEQFKRGLASFGRIPIYEIDRHRHRPRELYEDKEFNQRIFAAYENYMKVADRITILEGSAAASLTRLAELLHQRREQLRSSGGGSVLLVIDSLQLLLAVLRTNASASSLGAELELTAARADLDVQMLTARLKAIARELDIAVLATMEYYDQRICAMGPEQQSGAGERNQSMAALFHDTQFADTLMMLHRAGASLESLRGFYASGGGSANGEAQLWQARLAEIEKQRRATEEFKHLDSEFAVLDVLKNRAGPADKVLLVLNKPYASFEPLDFKG
ncbi:hypothetical protein IT575_11755 [bacterium]|nr:hypothetical protein [bacterium]